MRFGSPGARASASRPKRACACWVRPASATTPPPALRAVGPDGWAFSVTSRILQAGMTAWQGMKRMRPAAWTYGPTGAWETMPEPGTDGLFKLRL